MAQEPPVHSQEDPRDPRDAVFRWVVARRWWVIALYAVLVPLGVFLSLRVPTDSAIDRLIVASDPDFIATRAYQKVFPDPQSGLLAVECDDPFAPEVLRQTAALETAVAAVPGVHPYSLVSLYPRLKPGVDPAKFDAEALRRFAGGSDQFRRQGMVGAHFLGIALSFDFADPAARNRALEGIDRAIAAVTTSPTGVRFVGRIGRPWLESYLEREIGRASLFYFPLFGLFLVVLTLGLYRSWRALVAILATLGSSVALGVGFGALVGFSFTIVSSLVPLTILVTAMATLVYIHSRFVDQPEGVSVDDHQIFALGNKFVPVTTSIVAASLGFGALGVSSILPIRDLGLWLAGGLAITWVVAFTLFPALQKALATPTQRRQRLAVATFDNLVATLPHFSYRWRWVLVPGSIVLALAGAVALFGVPGFVAPMRMGVDALDYIDEDVQVAKDMRRFQEEVGLSLVHVWVKTPAGAVLDPEILRGISRFAALLEQDGHVRAVTGLPTVLRLRRYAAGQGDVLPDDPATFERLAGDLEQLMLQQPELRSFIDAKTLSQTQLTVIGPGSDSQSFREMLPAIRSAWAQAAASDAALAPVKIEVVGESVLQSKIAGYLVPTLVESFALTAALIFATFLVVFRNGAARLMAMIPSLFAILVTFLVMRIVGIPLNVATILIATTVLGTTENDQIHFFYHFQERRRDGTTEQAMHHTLRIAGRAIFFATLINAGGFLALAMSHVPPMRQFGVVTALAFVLSMVADFTALPAALWILFRERPDVAPAAAASSVAPGSQPRPEPRS